jgi:DNA-binding CsgD family transcriptional regulator
MDTHVTGDDQALPEKRAKIDELNRKVLVLDQERTALKDKLRLQLPTINARQLHLPNQESVTLEQLVASFEELEKLDDTLQILDNGNPETASVLRSLATEYRNQLVNFRAFNETILRMSDERFMRETQRGLSKLLRGYGTEYSRDEETEKRLGISETPIEILRGKKEEIRQYDEALDASYNDGEISEDELYTYKAFNHLIERTANRIGNSPHETVSDEQYNYFTSLPDDAIPSQRLNASTSSSDVDLELLNRTLGSVFDRIAAKSRNKIDLTPREKEIAARFGEHIERRQKKTDLTIGDRAIKQLNRLRERVRRKADTRTQYDRNKLAIELFTEENGLEENTKEYIDLLNKSLRGELDEDGEFQLGELRKGLKEVGEAKGLSNFVNLIEENEDMSRQQDTGDSTNIDTTVHVMDELMNTEEGQFNYQYAQNPHTAQAFLDRWSSSTSVEPNLQVWTISNISVKELIKAIGIPMSDVRTVRGSELKGRVGYTEAWDNQTGYIFKLGDNEIVLVQSDARSRIKIARADLDMIEESSGIVIRRIESVSTRWTTVFRKVPIPSDPNVPKVSLLAPLLTNSGFGLNATEFIDQEALTNPAALVKTQI